MAAERVNNNADTNKNYQRDLAVQQKNAPILRSVAAAVETPVAAPAVDRKNSIIEALKSQLSPVQRLAPTMATQDNPLVSRGSTPASPTAAIDPEKQLEDIAIKKSKGENLSEEDQRFLFRTSRAANAVPQAMPVAQAPQAFVMPSPQPQNPQLSAEQISQMSPSQMQAYQSQVFGDQAMQQKQLLDAQQKEAQSIVAGRTDRYQQQLDQMGQGLNAQDQARVDQFRNEQQAQATQAQNKTREVGLEQQAQLQNSAARRGFSRSSTTEQTLQKASQNVIDAVAEIENATGRAVNEYQAKLLDKQDSERQKIMDKLDSAYNDVDALKLKQLDEQHSLVKDLMKQDPASPENMIKLAEKLQTQRVEQAKLDAAEKKAVREDAIKNFQFMVGNFGSGYVQNMPPEVIANMAANMGVDPATIASLPKTMKEQENEWEKLKYFDNQDFELNKQLMNNNFQTQRDLNGFDMDIAKITANLGADIKLEEFKNKLSTEKDAKVRNGMLNELNMQYGNYASGGDKSALNFSAPVPHPSAKTDVVSLNAKLAQAYPDGYKFKAADGAGGLGGQCKWFAQQLTQWPDGSGWLGGSSLAATQQNFDKYAKQGKAFKVGEQEAKPGMSVLSSDSKTFGHGYVINAIQPDGKWVVTESNYKGPLTVSNNRVVDPKDPKIIGVLKTVPKSKFSVSNLGNIGSALGALLPGAKGIADAAGQFTQTNVGNEINNRINQNNQQPQEQVAQSQQLEITPDQLQIFSSWSDKKKELFAEQAPEVYAAFVKAGGTKSKSETRLPADKVVLLEDAKFLPGVLDSLETTIKSGKATFDPFWGNVNAINPLNAYDQDQQTTNAELSRAAQLIGKYMEGGVLRAEDEGKYKRMLPNATDTREVALKKLSDVRSMLQAKTQGYVSGFDTSGYDVSGYMNDKTLPTGEQSTQQNPQAFTEVKSKIQADLNAGYKSQDIVNAMLKSPYAADVQADLDKGYTAEELVKLYTQQ